MEGVERVRIINPVAENAGDTDMWRAGPVDKLVSLEKDRNGHEARKDPRRLTPEDGVEDLEGKEKNPTDASNEYLGFLDKKTAAEIFTALNGLLVVGHLILIGVAVFGTHRPDIAITSTIFAGTALRGFGQGIDSIRYFNKERQK